MIRKLEELAARAKEAQWQINLEFQIEGPRSEFPETSRDTRRIAAAVRLLKAFREISMHRERDGLVYRIAETEEP
ncbi:hypothetical protein [Mesorhizobium sp. M0586]|uniref:hypothetical protein n=1 Tax=unclassified Mesorhizobium TaxID=325217 RepID=UPI00333DA32D